jgi:hypothetical protein
MLPAPGGTTFVPSRTTRRKIQRARNPKPPAPRRTYNPPPRRRTVSYNPPPRRVVRRRSSGGGGGGGGSSRSTRSTVSHAKVHKAKRPSIPNLAKYLSGDLTYQQQLRRFGKTWADFLAEYGRQRSDISTEAGVAQKGLEDQRTKDLRDILYNYAGRGMLHSGTYATGRGEYETEYGKQLGELTRQKTRGLTNLSAEKTKFQGEQTLAKQEAKEEAIRRRAARYNLKVK